jgi:hypothetical protein
VEGYVLAEPGDVETLLERIERLLDNSLRRGMGEAARRLALQRSLERNVDEVLAVYDEVMRTRAREQRRRLRRARLPFVVRRTGALQGAGQAGELEPQAGAVS